jgi:hypothetical protein
MIHRFRKVNNKVYRGSSPNIEDVIMLNKKFGINKIVSLDYNAGKKIDRATKLLGMEHVMLPIDINKKSSLIKFIKQDIIDLLEDDGPTFIHCQQGKDRTGLAIAMYRCEHDGWSCERAVYEAKKLGFGVGIPRKVVKLYLKIINKACDKDEHDVSFAYDIVSNQREYPSSYQDYSLDAWQQGSWSPYEDYRIREFPYAKQEIDWPEQYQSRQDYDLDDTGMDNKQHGMPQSGGWDTSTNGIMGAGPSMVGSGYI